MNYARMYGYAQVAIVMILIAIPESMLRSPVQLVDLVILISGSAICFSIGEQIEKQEPHP
jgi:hypothetical protein